MLPMAVSTGWLAFFNLGIPKEASYQESDKKGILIWSVASSVGSATLQIAKSMGFHVYATASPKHHEYLQTLGNGPGKITLFDYNDKDVVAKIVKAAKDDGIVLDKAILATGSIDKCVQVLKQTKGDSSVLAKIASIPWSFGLLWWNVFPKWRKTSVTFVEPIGTVDEKKATYQFMFNKWLKEKLVDGGLVPSPKAQVMQGGIGAAQEGLVEWKKGVSGVKVVIEI
jgi:NADPH:quinone reductase-like Zn-dependent oxidoreductase